MADLQSALVARLLADAGVNAITTSIHWTLVPQGSDLPYVRLQTISDPRPQDLKGYHTSRVVRVQADCMARKYKTARALSEAIIAAVAMPAEFAGVRFGRGNAQGPRDLSEEIANTWIHRMSTDLLISHSIL